MPSESRRWWSVAVGLVVFLVGVGLIGYAFYLAYGLFATPPRVAVDIKVGKPMDFSHSATALVEVFLKVVMLIVMAGIGSMVANRGVKLYSASLHHPPQ